MRNVVARLAVIVICTALPATLLAGRANAANIDGSTLREPKGRAARPPVRKPQPIDRSGGKRFGKASFYGYRWAGRKMADGRHFNPRADVAASKTLPLGTVAKVTNLENGRSALVRVEDRGPFVEGRIIDLTVGTAERLGFREEGVVPVVVAPVAVPQGDGELKPGAGAAEVSPETAARALQEASAVAER
jgi:rare lipoprotein A